MSSVYKLTERDYEELAKSIITREIATALDIYRVDDFEGAHLVGQQLKYGRRFSGIVFRYLSPWGGHERERRLRRDFPDYELKPDGSRKDKGKYLGPPDRPPLLFFPMFMQAEHYYDWLNDLSIPIVFCEGEKKAIALMRIAMSKAVADLPPFISIGLAGIYGYLTRTRERTADQNGGWHSVPGWLNEFDAIPWQGRKVIAFYDANVFTNNEVRKARRRLAEGLHYQCGANVFFAEMPEVEGCNGPDDLAHVQGDEAVLTCIYNPAPAIKPTPRPQRELLSAVDRRARAEALRKAVSPEARASNILGKAQAKYLARLWAEADLSAESRDLLFTLEAMAEGSEELEFFYMDLYRTLFKCKGDESEQTPTGGRVLKSSPRKRLRDRFDKLASEEKRAGITFAYLTPGSQDYGGNHLPSRMQLLSRGYVAEIMIMAEEEVDYSRHKKAARERAFTRYVCEKSGIAYTPRLPKRRSLSKKIAEGWRRAQGDMRATIKRMEEHGNRKN